MNLEVVAEICHEAIRVFAQSEGDYSIKKWCEESELIREEYKNNVLKVIDLIDNHKNLEDVYGYEMSVSQGIMINIQYGLVSSLKSYMEESINV